MYNSDLPLTQYWYVLVTTRITTILGNSNQKPSFAHCDWVGGSSSLQPAM